MNFCKFRTGSSQVALEFLFTLYYIIIYSLTEQLVFYQTYLWGLQQMTYIFQGFAFPYKPAYSSSTSRVLPLTSSVPLNCDFLMTFDQQKLQKPGSVLKSFFITFFCFVGMSKHHFGYSVPALGLNSQTFCNCTLDFTTVSLSEASAGAVLLSASWWSVSKLGFQ